MVAFDLLSDELDMIIGSWESGLGKLVRAKQEDRRTAELIREIFSDAVSSLEGFSDELAAKLAASFRQDADFWDWIVDAYYSREAVANVRGMVGRFLKLRSLPAGVVPDQAVKTYIRESTRCYVYGFSQASIALSRAALEAGLNDYLRRRLKGAGDLKLMEKVKWAERCKLVDRSLAAKACEVSKAAGMVLHQKPASLGLAFDTLSRTRDFLLTLYEN